MTCTSRQPRLSFCERLEARFCLSGVSFAPHDIFVNESGRSMSVFAADLDGDGDVDVLSVFSIDDRIAWHENIDGKGTFGPQRVITTAADFSLQRSIPVYAADVDGDGDVDVLSASVNDDKIAWYENRDGMGSFGKQHIITSRADGAMSVYAVDVDGDGDVDVLSASAWDGNIAWYENTDGKGDFEQHLITTDANGVRSAYAADLDGDGDMDVLSASSFGVRGESKIAWYENTDGKGSFVPRKVISTAADTAHSAYAADIDGDGDVDVLSASLFDGNIAWYENTDSTGSFGPQQVIASRITGGDAVESVYIGDLDGDGDLDVLSASGTGWPQGGKISWYENTDGRGTFGTRQVIATANEAVSVHAVDADGDGDLDVLSALPLMWPVSDDDKDTIAWHEHLSPPNTPGDANQDYRFDQLDIVQVLQAGRYLMTHRTALGAVNWEEGRLERRWSV